MLWTCILFILLSATLLVSGTTYSCNLNASCGCSSSPARVSRILGGTVARNDTWGFVVSISINMSAFCGGTLVSSTWVVTAAACLAGCRPSDVIVSAATNELLGGKQWQYASAVINNPNYDSKTWVNNIALIRVSSPFNMSDPSISTVCLPMATTDDYPPINSTVVALGWGLTSANSSSSATLRQVSMSRIAYDTDFCNESLTNQTTQFCAGAYDGSREICPGDTGGPLVMFTASQQWVLVGVSSYSPGCSNTGYPSVFIRVTAYLDWIRSMNVTNTNTVSDITSNTTMTTIPTTTTTITTIAVIPITTTMVLTSTSVLSETTTTTTTAAVVPITTTITLTSTSVVSQTTTTTTTTAAVVPITTTMVLTSTSVLNRTTARTSVGFSVITKKGSTFRHLCVFSIAFSLIVCHITSSH